MKVKYPVLVLFSVILILITSVIKAQSKTPLPRLKISLQKRIPSDIEKGKTIIVNEIQEWSPEETAIIICDMWDQHWCKGAASRVAEMTPFMNNVIKNARQKGVLIVHAPSECMAFYKNHPARKLGQKYNSKKAKSLINSEKLESEKNAVWPVDQSDEGCDCTPECKLGTPWTRQIDLLEISDNDAISDAGSEIGGLFYQKGIKNVILMGVHTNMCVIGRPFGLRNMVRLGMNVVLMRDLTDTMYDSKQWPNVNHFTGNSLVNEYIETYVCPTILSTDFTLKKQFRFREDKRPIIAFITAENEYYSNLTLPEFAHELFLKNGVNCEFAVGKPVYKGNDVHNIENLQILEDADLAVFYIRRRALEQEKMEMIRNYVASGKPVLGIRTASHSFDAKAKILRPGTSELLAQWPEFDQEVLGGNYQDHYGSGKEIITVSVVPGMENHPVLKGVSMDNFTSPSSLYKNRPLRSEKATVLLLGTIPSKPSEPIMWINNTGKNMVIYCSLGSITDWKNGSFRQLMTNSVGYLLNIK